MQIAILLFEGITALDAVGPYEVLARLPGAETVFVGAEVGLVRTDNGVLGLQVDRTLADVPAPDVLVVPGGPATRQLVHDEALLDWVRGVDRTSTWTTSVCTGSLVLAAAGLLSGVRATTHWLAMDALSALGALPVAERVVQEGKVITAAGVSSGIDMALVLAAHLAGDDVAQAIQLGIEYDPRPPFASGSPTSAPAHIVDRVRRGRRASLPAPAVVEDRSS